MPVKKTETLSFIKDAVYLISIVVIIVIWLIKSPEDKFSTKTEMESLSRELREHKEMARENWSQNNEELRAIRTAVSETKVLLISMKQDD